MVFVPGFCLSRRMVRQYEYQPCIPTRGTEVPAGPDWFHEIKHDGYRLIVQREGKRVRLLTRRGYDWSDRYVAEAALRLRKQSFVVDGEAVVLGPDGISDFEGLHSGTCNEEVRLYAFDLLSDDAPARTCPGDTPGERPPGRRRPRVCRRGHAGARARRSPRDVAP